MPGAYREIVEEVERCLRAAQGSLRKALASLIPGDLGVRAMSRRLEVGRGVAGAVVEFLNAPDAASLLSHLPGRRGRVSLLNALRAKLKSNEWREVDRAFASLETALETHVGDDATFRSLTGGAADGDRERKAVMRSHRDAYAAMSHIWGSRIAGEVKVELVTPNPDGDACDLTVSYSFLGIERLRPGPELVLHQPLLRYGEDDRGGAILEEASSTAIAAAGSMILERHSSSSIGEEELRITIGRNGRPQIGFGVVSPRRRGSLDLTVAERLDRVGSRFADGDDVAESTIAVPYPIGVLVFDLWIHRSLPRGGDPTAALYGGIRRIGDRTSWHEEDRLLLPAEVETPEDPRRLPKPLARWSDRHEQVATHLAASRGFDLTDFECFRIVLPHPPIASSLTMRWRLASRR